MTGVPEDLRDKTRGVNAHIWVMTYGGGCAWTTGRPCWPKVRTVEGVSAAAPFIRPRSIRTRRVFGGASCAASTRAVGALGHRHRRHAAHHDMLPAHALGAAADGRGRGARRARQRAPGRHADGHLVPDAKVSPVGGLMPTLRKFEVTGAFAPGCTNTTTGQYTSIPAAQELTGMGHAVCGSRCGWPTPRAAT